MISPRTTRLLRVRDLRALHRGFVTLLAEASGSTGRTAVLLPSRAAAEQLRQTLAALQLERRQRVPGPPTLLTREEWYGQMHATALPERPLLADVERELIFRAAARSAIEAGASPPFRLRPGLLAETMLFYDALRRQRCSTDDFERRMLHDLEPGAELDRGARRLARQTRFLAETFRHYADRLQALDAYDEHRLRDRLLDEDLPAPFSHLVVAAGDEPAEAGGLWPADFDLLSRQAGLDRIDILSTDRTLDAGVRQRLNEQLPGIEEIRFDEEAPDGTSPVLVTPADGQTRFFMARDREEELTQVARVLLADSRPVRAALVFQRPLPYVYLGRQIFGAAGIPAAAYEGLPLAGEPAAAALDVVLAFVASRLGRRDAVQLLRCPLLSFGDEGGTLSPREVAALDRALREARSDGDVEGLRRLAEDESRTAGAPSGGRAWARRPSAERGVRILLGVVEALAPLLEPASPRDHLDALLAFFTRHLRGLPSDDPLFERHARARAGVLAVLQQARDAHSSFDDRSAGSEDLIASLRRWIRGKTFGPRAEVDGVALLDARAARFGSFDRVWLVGLVDDEWPNRRPRNIFYPARLLAACGWPRDDDAAARARAEFDDLLHLASEQVAVSSFSLEDDTLAAPSVLLERLETVDLQVRSEKAVLGGRSLPHEALLDDPIRVEPLTGDTRWWAERRLAGSNDDPAMFHGFTGAPAPRTYSVSAVDDYLACPFKYFSRHVLRLEEERAESATLTPDLRGRFLHEVFHAFYEEWERRTGGAEITTDRLDEAMEAFEEVSESWLDRLTDTDRPVERARLVGSAVTPGAGPRVLRAEAERNVRIVARLLEQPFDDHVRLEGLEGERSVAVRGIIDRLDLFADGTFRLVDYKTGQVPKRDRSVQLAVYSAAAARLLERLRGGTWRVAEAAYLATAQDECYVPLSRTPDELSAAIAAGQARFVDAIANIERGRFPPSPAEPSLCRTCGYASVCRKDYVEAQ